MCERVPQMNKKFKAAVDSLHPKYKTLIGSMPDKPSGKLPKKGVYLFSEEGKPIYVGRSDNIPQRRRHHRSANTNQAALSRLMACEELELKPDYRKGRDKFKGHPGFAKAFYRARKRVSAMSFRAVEENDPIQQALLEIYCAVAARTRYNSFGVH